MRKPVIATVSGTRPEIIKLAPVYHALVAQDWAEVKWIHTGQHADMAQQILRCFDVTPDIRLKREGSRAATRVFRTTYQRVVYFTADKPNFSASTGKDFAVGQIFPYVVKRDYYGQRILPESLGNIEYDISAIDPTSNYNYTWQDLYTNAQYAMTVRDGFASFFFHPFWLEPELGVPGFEDFKKVVEGITQLGFTWIAPSKVQ